MLKSVSEQMPCTVEIEILGGEWPEREDLQKIANCCLKECQRVANPELVPDSELSLVFSDNEHLRQLNMKWRGIDLPTNVLSFPVESIVSGPLGPLLGDVVIGFEKSLAESTDENKKFEHHLSHLIVHGILHLFGFDHISDEEAELMEDMERQALSNMGISDPFIAGKTISNSG